jgi:hypothetical protein
MQARKVCLPVILVDIASQWRAIGASDKSSYTKASKTVRTHQMRLGQIKKQLVELGASVPLIPPNVNNDSQEPSFDPPPPYANLEPALVPESSSAGPNLLGKRTSEDVAQEAKRARVISSPVEEAQNCESATLCFGLKLTYAS